MRSFNPNRPWWPGQDDGEADLVEQMLAPRGNARLTPQDWAQAAKEIDVASEPQPALPGLTEHGVTATDRDHEVHRRWKSRAQEIANAREVQQLVVTTTSIKQRGAR
jgi:hypothetical protein